MSMRMDMRYCGKCKNYWSFNPSVGVMQCPNCGIKGAIKGMGELLDLFSGDRENEDRNNGDNKRKI